MSESKVPAPPVGPAPNTIERSEAEVVLSPRIDRVIVEDSADERQGGPNKCGRKWVEYWKMKGTSAIDSVKFLPEVDVKFKVYRLSDFDGKAGTFYVETVLMLDWVDPSLEIAGDTADPDFHEHFWPKPELLNLTSDSDGDGVDWDTTRPKYKFDKKNENGWGVHRASMTIKYRKVMYARLDFRHFPFDHQSLELSIKLLSVRVPGVKSGTRPKACHPNRWRKKEGGHELVTECDCLPEFTLVRLATKAYNSKYGPFPEDNELEDYHKDKEKDKLYRDVYTLQIIMTRDSVSVLWNMCFSLLVIDVMIFTAHGLHISELGDRLSINLTLLLTAMAFKWVLADTLPPTPYLTTMEIYVVQTFAILFFQGVAFWLLSDAFNYRCGSGTGQEEVSIDWITGAVKHPNVTDVTADISCESVHVLDRVVLFLELAAFFAKNLWFAYHIATNRQSEVAKQTHFMNLGRLKEYQMPEKLTMVTHDDHDKEQEEIERRITLWKENKGQASPKTAKVGPNPEAV